MEIFLSEKRKFDFEGFQRAVSATVTVRKTTWKTVSEETGISQTTLSRMARGRQPDAEGLTALAAWSGLNPVDFMSGAKHRRESIAMVGRLLRDDPNLDSDGAEALEAIISAAYGRLKRTST